MSSFRSLIPARSLALAVLLSSTLGAFAADKPTVRAAVGKPLQAAQAALAAKKYDEAAGKLSEAEAVGSLTPYEKYLVLRLKSSVAVGKGDYKAASADYEGLISSGQLAPGEQLQALEILSKLEYSAKDFAKTADAVQRYRAAGGKDAATLAILPQADYLAGRYADAAKELNSQIAELEAAGKAPSETQLQLLASCALKQNDMTGYAAALEKLVTYDPKQEYWLDLIARTAGRKGFSDKLGLDVDRLRFRTGTLRTPGDYIEAAELAIQAGFPGEADDFLKQGTQQKILGVGNPADTERQKRLQTLVDKKVAEDKTTLAQGETQAAGQPGGDGLINSGMAYVFYGQGDKGLALIQKGIAKGNLKNPDAAKLHLGYAQLVAGHKDDALKSFREVKAADGSKDLARLLAITARGNQQPEAPAK